MKEIKLTQGQVALVDDEDYESLNQYKWAAAKKHGDLWYARRGGGKNKQIYMHHMILRNSNYVRIDHRDRNGLNNQKNNLRPCTPQQNSWNSKPRANTSSKYKGVSLRSEMWLKKRWRAVIEINGKNNFLGDYHTEEEAAKAYDMAALKRQGNFARLNIGG